MAELYVGLENNQKILIPTSSEARSGNPLGTILAIHSNVVPYGYLPCNGVAFDENQYPALYALLGDNHTPDLRECNLVGAGQSERTILDDAGHAHDVYTIGQFKDDQIQGHWHGDGTTSQISGTSTSAQGFLNVTGNGWYNKTNATTKDVTSDGINGTPRYGTTTHGKNVGVNYVIKATSGLEETQQDYVLQSLLEADSYSTEEVATGKKWIDGKMIYRKVVTGAISNGTTLVNDVDTLVSQYGSLMVSSSSWGPFPRDSGSSYAVVRLNESNHSLFADFSTTWTCKLTIEYTKAD